MLDGQRDRQAPTIAVRSSIESRTKSGTLPAVPMRIGSPSEMIAVAITKIIVSAPLLTTKDAPFPSPADFAIGSSEEKWRRVDGLVRGVAAFVEGRGNLHREVTRYTMSLVQAVLALNKSKTRPTTADKAVGTPPILAGGVSSKQPAQSPLATRATPKRYATTAASRKSDDNNNEVDDQDGFSLIDRRRRRQRKQPAVADDSARTRQQPKLRPAPRRVHHRPDAIIIRAKDASTYAGILKTLKSESTLQKTVGSSVKNIRRSAAGALVLQFRKGVDNAPSLGTEVGKVLGDVATASAVQHTTAIEIRDLDECVTKTEIAEELAKSLGAPYLNEEAVKTLRKAYARTQTAVAAMPDDLAARALKLGHIRIGWVNCRIRGRKEALRCYRCWSPDHMSARCKGPDRSAHGFRCGQTGHRVKDCKNKPTCVFCQEQGAVHDHASTSQYCPLA
uniref:CCHC-type domain-containing protein n=1 Tax=Trichogramma kaykai TaxID=54128 RepID=A0ABD2X0W7_9HYME